MMTTMSSTIYSVLDELRAQSTSESDKGSKFERLIAEYMRTDPLYAEQFSNVYLWQDWPGRGGKHDTGIDIVAVDRLTGGNIAIQCKFYDPHHSIAKPDIDSFLSASGKDGFTQRIIISTTDKWNLHAEDSLQGQQVPVRRIGLADLEASPIDWDAFDWAKPEDLPVSTEKKVLRAHQVRAVADVTAGFETSDRGKLIMACGTGKTFTSLRLAEQLAGAGKSVLFLVPSISLLSQTLREWTLEASLPLASIAVCSDKKATVRSNSEDISAVDLALPSTTNVATLEARWRLALGQTASMTVVFSTYQSIDVIAQAQKVGELPPLDLIVCDEAHRTTGTTLSGEDESAFVRIHNQGYIAGRKRLYMTATPRIYDDSSKAKAGEANAVIASMDDESVFGPEFHRLGFGEAVSKGLLSDYKVLVLAVDETAVSRTFQVQLSEGGELRLDDAAKIVGCWNGLAKRGAMEHSFAADPQPMRRAVAFAGTIADSKRVESLFAQTVAQYAAAHDIEGSEDDPVLTCEIQHVDGTYNALQRNTRLDWLRGEVPDGTCRILTNARCLSEGVDVPALDAVMFLSPRKSVVDIVQSVGRVMRKSPGKAYGYIILPIGIPSALTPEQALRDNTRYAAVWEVLQALRAHDERFNAMVNRIELVKQRDDKINVIGIPGPEDGGSGSADEAAQSSLPLIWLDEWREAIYAKIVAKVGSRRYWEEWAKDIADIAQRHITRITALLDGGSTTVTQEFDTFLDGLRGNLNENISRSDAVEMLAQHLITRPVFDALFGGYDFAAHNPVAQTMERMLTALDEHSLDSENESLEKFYDSVRDKVQGVDKAEGRQKLIVQLYDTFFATAFKKTVDKLGIVYTPVEIVDFILRSADDVLREHFGHGLTDQGVHILDGFVGTGTFIVRLLQLGLITPEDLPRKYAHELHANEILLLAYYIAAVNIETTYQDVIRGSLDADAPYEPFPGLILTDTFQSWEDDDRPDLGVFTDNNERLERLKALDIQVIVGNPPWSVGQDNANENNGNDAYPSLDAEIGRTFVARSVGGQGRSLYDSYIRAIKWATLRIKDRGVIAYVTNGGWLDSNTADGMRLTLADEFTDIYVLNLRGDGRKSGDLRKREGGTVFGAGSRATVAVTLLVKNPLRTGPARIHYADIGDYLTRDQKLAELRKAGSFSTFERVSQRSPNEQGDWITRRGAEFGTFLSLGAKAGEQSLFGSFTLGLGSNRDTWVYNSSAAAVGQAMNRAVGTYSATLQGRPSREDHDIKWTESLETRLAQGEVIAYDAKLIRVANYRPFCRQFIYADPRWIHRPAQWFSLFPLGGSTNQGMLLTGVSSHAEFSVLASDRMTDKHLLDTGQFFARWRYEKAESDEMLSFGEPDGEVVDGYRRVDNITDHALSTFRAAYGEKVTKDDIFDYVYGLLHSPDYRETYEADLKKMLPRIPLVTDPWPYIDAGRRLGELHLGYESVEPYPLDGLEVAGPVGDGAYDFFRVEKMTFAKVRDEVTKKLVADRSTIVYNSRITLGGIPEEAYRYMLGSRSAVEWIIDRYQVKTDKPSGIVNDPNDWSREVGDPRYIIDLLARIVTVSLETMKLVDALPPLDIREQA